MRRAIHLGSDPLDDVLEGVPIADQKRFEVVEVDVVVVTSHGGRPVWR